MLIKSLRFLFIVSILSGLVFPVSSAIAQNKVGFVNTQRLLEETAVGKTAQDDLSRLGKEKDRLISKSAKRINDLKQQLSRPGASQVQSKTIEDKLKKLYSEHDELVKKSNESLRYEEARLIQFILRHADKSLRKVAIELGFSMVLTDPNVVGYIADSADLTGLIIKEMNRK